MKIIVLDPLLSVHATPIVLVYFFINYMCLN